MDDWRDVVVVVVALLGVVGGLVLLWLAIALAFSVIDNRPPPDVPTTVSRP